MTGVERGRVSFWGGGGVRLLSMNFANLVPICSKIVVVIVNSNVLNQVCSVVFTNRYLRESALTDIRQRAFQGTRLRSL